MKIDDVIEKLESIKKEFGNIECLIEIEHNGNYINVPVEEISIEIHLGYGAQVKFSK